MNNLTFILHNIIALFVVFLNQKLKFAICKICISYTSTFSLYQTHLANNPPTKKAGQIAPTDISIIVLIQLIPHIHIILQSARMHRHAYISCRLLSCEPDKDSCIFRLIKYHLFLCLFTIYYELLSIHVRYDNCISFTIVKIYVIHHFRHFLFDLANVYLLCDFFIIARLPFSLKKSSEIGVVNLS